MKKLKIGIANLLLISLSCLSLPFLNSPREITAPAYFILNKDAKPGDYVKSMSVDKMINSIIKLLEKDDKSAKIRAEINIDQPPLFGGKIIYIFEYITNNSGKVTNAYRIDAAGSRSNIKIEKNDNRTIIYSHDIIKKIRSKQLDIGKYNIIHYDNGYTIQTDAGAFDCIMTVERDKDDELVYRVYFLNENVLGFIIKQIGLSVSEYNKFKKFSKSEKETFQNDDTDILIEMNRK